MWPMGTYVLRFEGKDYVKDRIDGLEYGQY